jgi:DNA-binding transcriptional MocR family regulator
MRQCQSVRMDQDKSGDIGWWIEVVFLGWRERNGPRYEQLAAAVLDALEQRALRAGQRIPAERVLADALGVSRGTVVASVEQLVSAGVVRRRQGAGTFIVGPPSWRGRQPESATVITLLRRVAAGRETIDLASASPADRRHLPEIDAAAAWHHLDGPGSPLEGMPETRAAIAEHLTRHQGLPTTPEQIIVTSGAREALSLVHRSIEPGNAPIVTGCPTTPGNAQTMAGREVLTVEVDSAGLDTTAVERLSRRHRHLLVHVMSAGHDPTGAQLALPRRAVLAALADRHQITVIEDLRLADLALDGDAAPSPIAALTNGVVVVGSTSNLLWAGLRIGWIRCDDAELRGEILRHKSAHEGSASAPAQMLTALLLGAIDRSWLLGHRAALRERRDHMLTCLASQLPAWRPTDTPGGLRAVGRAAGARGRRHVRSRCRPPRRDHPPRHCGMHRYTT